MCTARAQRAHDRKKLGVFAKIAVDPQVQKQKIAWRAGARKGNIMHKYPQNQSYVGSSGQTLTKNVSMTLCSWQTCHQTHVLCGRTTFVANQIRYQINTVATPVVAWTKGVAYLQSGGKSSITSPPTDVCPHQVSRGGAATHIVPSVQRGATAPPQTRRRRRRHSSSG